MREMGREMPHGCYLVPERSFSSLLLATCTRGVALRRTRGGSVDIQEQGKARERTPHRQSVIKVFSVLIAASDRHKPLFYIALFDNREELQTQNGNLGSWLPTR